MQKASLQPFSVAPGLCPVYLCRGDLADIAKCLVNIFYSTLIIIPKINFAILYYVFIIVIDNEIFLPNRLNCGNPIFMFDHLTRAIQHNCDISDARFGAGYSLCTLILKLRNRYKWEQGLQPWDEPEPAVILDWIEAKEEDWQKIGGQAYQELPVNGTAADPYDLMAVNSWLTKHNLYYGAGYGRSLKAIFFLAEVRDRLRVAGCPVLILGRELAREISAPFALLQDDLIIIRHEPLRFFFWDQVQELQASTRLPLRHALRFHGVVGSDLTLDQQAFRDKLDTIVESEIPIFIHHEIGELRETGLGRAALQALVAAFPDSPIELVARGVKDILADTHPEGMLSFILQERRTASLSFYRGFLDGMRKLLFPEIGPAYRQFREDDDWAGISRARDRAREANLDRAAILQAAVRDLATIGSGPVGERLKAELLTPLDLVG